MTPTLVAILAAFAIIVGFAAIPIDREHLPAPITFVAHAHCSPAACGSDVVVFFKIYSNADDMLLAASCPEADSTEVHLPFAVPSFAPMQGVSADVVLVHLHNALRVSDEVPLLLHFDLAGDVETLVKVSHGRA